MLQDTPADSPFKPPWWYRTEFDVPEEQVGRSHRLNFDGINYRANVWVNGSRIASSSDVAGAYRQYSFDITPLTVRGRNAVAVEVFGPEPHDLSIMWVDWNPTPPDKNLGLWGNASVAHTGAVALRGPAKDLPWARVRRCTAAQAGIEVFGDTALLDRWQEQAKF